MVIFCLLCILFFFILQGKLVGLWDELRLWGAYPKILHYTGTLQMGENTILFHNMQSYLPGMPLFIYYLTSFSSAFTDWHIFYGYAILGVSLFLPALKNMKWKNAWLVLPIAAVILFFPRLFYSFGIEHEYYYNSLFIDTTLGLFVGYSFYLAVTSCFDTKYDTYAFAATLFMLIVLKDSGIVFALLSLVAAVVSYILRKKDLARIKRKICFAVSLPFAALLIWKILMIQNGITNHIAYSLDTMQLSSAIKMVKLLITEPMMSLNFYFGTISMSFIAISFLIIILDALMIFTAKKEEQKALIASSDILIIANIAFLIGYYILMNSAFQGNAESFHRYMGTLMLGDAFYLLLRFLSTRFLTDTLPQKDAAGQIEKKSLFPGLKRLRRPVKICTISVLTVILAAYSIFAISHWAKFNGGWNNKAKYYADNVLSALEEESDNDSDGPADIYIDKWRYGSECRTSSSNIF